jgi:hypothetical protein
MSDFGLNKEKVQAMLTDLESEQIERTISVSDTGLVKIPNILFLEATFNMSDLRGIIQQGKS